MTPDPDLRLRTPSAVRRVATAFFITATLLPTRGWSAEPDRHHSTSGLTAGGSKPVFVLEGELFGHGDPAGQTDWDHFGNAVAVSGDTVVVGAPDDDTPAGENAGAAYVFVRTGASWTEQQKLLAPAGMAGEHFGWSVAVSGDTVVVGAVGGPAGAAYVFVRTGTTWSAQQQLVPAEEASFFGYSVSLSSDTAVVGTPHGNLDKGAAFVFVRTGTTWSEQHMLVASDAAYLDEFGLQVSLSGDTIAVGAPHISGPAIGKAYVFVRSGTTWTQQQTLLASDGAVNDNFGYAVSVSGDTVLVGAPYDDTPAGGNSGSVYVFDRSGTTWTEDQKILPPPESYYFGLALSISGDRLVVGGPLDQVAEVSTGAVSVFRRSAGTWTYQQRVSALSGAVEDDFGQSVALSADTFAAGAPNDDTPSSLNAGSAHVFREFAGPGADLGITKTDGSPWAVPGAALTYTVVATNAGPDPVTDATVSDLLPADLLAPTWICSASAGSSCTAGGSGSINDVVNLAVGGTATYTVIGTVAAGATGVLTNTASIAPTAGVTDPSLFNNSATDIDTLTPQPDLAITKADSDDPVSPGAPFSYFLTVTNLGPSNATAATISDTLPSQVAFVSASPGCAFAGGTLTCALGALTAGSAAAVTVNVMMTSATAGVVVNTATVAGSGFDPNDSNNSASAATATGALDGELAHGTDAVYDLAAQPGPVTDSDVFRIYQDPHSSYEILVDAASGDIGAGSGPLLDLTYENGTQVIYSSQPVGTGPSRSLRFWNYSIFPNESQLVRVRSAGCTTDCGPDDTYRIRVYETTYAIPRFNNRATQRAVVVLQNRSSYLIFGEIHYLSEAGAQIGIDGFSLEPKQSTLINTWYTAPNISGSIRVVNNGRYGDLCGKTVAVEPATGFSFDTPMEPRPK